MKFHKNFVFVKIVAIKFLFWDWKGLKKLDFFVGHPVGVGERRRRGWIYLPLLHPNILSLSRHRINFAQTLHMYTPPSFSHTYIQTLPYTNKTLETLFNPCIKKGWFWRTAEKILINVKKSSIWFSVYLDVILLF